jgi:putative transposase
VWNCKIFGATVYETESIDLSARLFTKACFIHGVNPDGLALHADNGAPMLCITLLPVDLSDSPTLR